MYSWEIKQLMELKGFLISVREYLNICDTSPQIKRVTYDPGNDIFKIETKDDYNFKFKVKKMEEQKKIS